MFTTTNQNEQEKNGKIETRDNVEYSKRKWKADRVGEIVRLRNPGSITYPNPGIEPRSPTQVSHIVGGFFTS